MAAPLIGIARSVNKRAVATRLGMPGEHLLADAPVRCGAIFRHASRQRRMLAMLAMLAKAAQSIAHRLPPLAYLPAIMSLRGRRAMDAEGAPSSSQQDPILGTPGY